MALVDLALENRKSKEEYQKKNVMSTKTEDPSEAMHTDVAVSRVGALKRRPAIIFATRPIAGKGRNAARLALAGFWLVMAGYNVAVTLPGAGGSRGRHMQSSLLPASPSSAPTHTRHLTRTFAIGG